jgi:hypothetical protein
MRPPFYAPIALLFVAALWTTPAGRGHQLQQGQQSPPAGAAPQAPPAAPAPGRVADLELLRQFDRDKNGWLNREERNAARPRLAELRPARGGGPGRGGAAPAAIEPGRKLSPDAVPKYPGVPLYDAATLRTIFIDFEEADWEEELELFYHTDVELPATLRVDGRTYQNVGVQFRGNSSFFTVPRGRKRSLSLSLDHVDGKQRLEGYRALTLLNAHSDPTFVRSILYLDMARQYIPALKANYMRVAINGESWGVYVNQQRYNRDFLRDAFKTEDGARFKSSNRSRNGSFSYLGEDIAEYRRWYEIQSADRDESWRPLINVTKVLAQTPPDQLKKAIEPIFNVDGALRYLALDMVMMSGDGYWLHGSDFNLYLDAKGVLHILHHDANEAFTAQPATAGSAAGRGGPPGPRDATVDPLAATDDPNKALRHKLLGVPEYRDRYLRYVRDIARDTLDWTKLEPKINAWRALIRADVEADTRKLSSTEEFTAATFGPADGSTPSPATLKGFILARRAYLLAHPAIVALPK